MGKNACDRCRFWDGLNDKTEDFGYCRRRAPQVARPSWPVTIPADWCGEFEAVEPIVLKDSPELRAAFEEAVNSDIQLLDSDSEIENRRGFAKAAGGIPAGDLHGRSLNRPEGWTYDPLIDYYVPPDFASKYADLSKNRGNR